MQGTEAGIAVCMLTVPGKLLWVCPRQSGWAVAPANRSGNPRELYTLASEVVVHDAAIV